MACIFARQIALLPPRYKQVIETVEKPLAPEHMASDLADRIARLVNDPQASAAVVLYPLVSTLEQFARGILGLRDHTGWAVTTSALADQGHGSHVAVHVNRLIPFPGNPKIPSEALALGPFSEFPATRRAPVLGFEMYVGDPRPLDPKSNQPSTKAHLAHIEMNLPTHATFERMWNDSIARRLVSLGGLDDNRAKAKVAFVIPPALAVALGCEP